ncbi:unnamed protein product [Rhodiola kirilowii]
MKYCAASNKHGLPYPGFVKKFLNHLGVYQPDVESVISTALDMVTFDNINGKFDAEKGWQNARIVTTHPKPAAPLVVEPLYQKPLYPEEGLPAVLEVLKALSEKVEVLAEKVTSLESMADKVLKGSEVD